MTDKILCEIKSFATEGIFHLAVSNIVGNRYEGVVNGIDIYLKRETYTTVSLWIQDPNLRWISLGEFVTDSKYHAIQEIIGKLKLYFQEDTMTNMTKAELEQKYWEAQRKIDEYERERDRFLKDIDERDQSISDLIDANEKLTKENDKLSVDISREKAKHDTATEKCKELAKDVEFWKGKAYEMDKKNCELRSRNRELEKDCDARADVINYQRERIEKLEKELNEEKQRPHCKVEVTPETCYQIDMLAREIDRLEKENKNCKEMLDRIHEIIEGDISNKTDETDNKKNPKEFKEILVRECFGRPYYEILYKEDGQMHVGYSSYKLDKVSEWLKEFFID